MGLLIGNVDTSFIPDSVKAALDETVPMYGVLFEPDNTVGTRTYDAAGLVWQRSSNTVEGIDNFKNIVPFKTRECCRIWNDTSKTASYVYKDDYSNTEWETIRKGTHASISGDIMIEVSEFWYRRVQREDKKFEIVVAPKYKAGFKPDPWHYVNGKHYEKRYISKYKLNEGFKSLSGQTPTTNTTLNTARTALKAKGMNELTLEAYYSLVMLMLVKYATTDVQNVVANGIASDYITQNTGGTDNVLGADGSATTLSANENALALGIEDFWGNVWSYIDGAVGYAGKIYFKDVDSIQTDPSSANDLVTWTATTSTYPNGSGSAQITAIANDAEYDWLFIPSTDTNATTQTTNDTYFPAYGLQCLFVGGSSVQGGGVGLFIFSYDASIGFTNQFSSFCAIA